MPREPQIPFEQSVYRPVTHPISTHGVAPDLPQESLGDNYLASAVNFLVRSGRVTQRGGVTTRFPSASALITAGTTLFTLFEFTSTRAPASAMIIGAFNGGGLSYAAATSTAWTSITGTVTTQARIIWTTYMTASAGQYVIGTDNVNPAVKWTGSTASSFTVLTTAVTGTYVASWRSHLLLSDTTDTADGKIVTRIHWSALGDPNTWSGTASAGSIDLTDANATRVLAMVPLRSTLIAYKEEGAHAIIYKSAPFYFTQSLLHSTISLVARRCIVPVDNGAWHFMLTQEGAILWDGQTIRPIGRNRVDKTILQSLKWEARDDWWAAWNPLRQEIYLSVTTGVGGAPNRIWVYNMTYDSWWETDIRARHAIYSTLTATTPAMLAAYFRTGDSVDHGNAWYLFSGINDGGTAAVAVSSSLQTGLYDYGAVQHKGVFKMAVMASPASGTTATIAITKSGQENPTSAPVFASSQSIIVTGGAGLPKIDFRLTDRWLSYRATHAVVDETCEITSLIPYVTERTDARKRRS